MKKQNYGVKLFVITLLIVTFGFLQLTAEPMRVEAAKSRIKILASAYRHIPGLEKSEKKIIKTVVKSLNLEARKDKYHRCVIDVIDIDANGAGDYLVVSLLKKKTYAMDTVKIAVGADYRVEYVEKRYKMKHGDASADWLPDSRACNCPDETVEVVLSTCETGIPTAVAGIEYSYDAAVAAGYKTVKLLGSQENTVDIDNWLCCPNLKYWGRIGHGYTGGIVLDDAYLTSSYFDSLEAGALAGKSLYFNSCEVFNNPLKDSILNKDAYKYIGGICSLYIGSSEEVFKCWNDHNFYQVTPPSSPSDEMCYWSVDCESSTGYPELGCHGCGGPGLIFPEPGGIDPPVADFSGTPTTLGAGGTVFFTDLSSNIPTSWDWTFAGGTPATGTDKNPEVVYNSVGTYAVTLTATNSLGSDTETKAGYITVTIPQTPVADFSASSTSIFAGDSVDFTDTSANTPTSWAWTFAGGTPATGTDRNPSVTYSAPGTYTVTLIATNSAGSDTETKVDYMFVDIKPYCDSHGTNFSYEWIGRVQVGDIDNSSGAAGYTDFTSITGYLTGGDTVNVILTPEFSGTTYTEYWKIYIDYNGDHDFEDTGEEVFSGVGSSTVSGSFTVQESTNVVTRMRVSMKYAAAQTPCETFTYGEVEDYTVDITSGVINPPVAGFTASATTITQGDTVNFTDTSTNNPTSWSWTFAGGTPSSSTTQDPSVTYNTVGTYTVELTATNAGGSDTETKVNYITVNAPPPPTADFTASATTINEGDSVTFTDTSTGNPTSWDWTFAGGTPSSSTAQNPTITYNTAGTYTVTLIAANGSGSDTESKVGYITVNEIVVLDMFVYDITQSITKQGSKYYSNATVTIRNTDNNPVAGASVYITWSGSVSGSASGTTAADGTVTFTSDKVKSTGPFTITVTNVTHATLPYNSSLNNETSDSAYY